MIGDAFTYGPGDRGKYPHVTRVWNVKTGQLVGEPLPWSNWRKPGPRPGTMILSVEAEEDKNRFFLHDAASGATADLPVRVIDAGGDKIAYLKRIDGKQHVRVATLRWGEDQGQGKAKPATKPSPTNAPATKPASPSR